jgi:hypothetical protein
VGIKEYAAEVEKIAGKPVRRLALTHLQPGDEQPIAALVARGVEDIVTSIAIRERLNSLWKGEKPAPDPCVLGDRSAGDGAPGVVVIPADDVFSRAALFTFLSRVCFFPGRSLSTAHERRFLEATRNSGRKPSNNSNDSARRAWCRGSGRGGDRKL